MTTDVSYQCKFDKGDRIIENGQMKVILDKRDKEYKMKKGEGGKVKWQDARDIDSRAKLYEPRR